LFSNECATELSGGVNGFIGSKSSEMPARQAGRPPKDRFWIKMPGNFVSGPAEIAPCIPEKWV